jgi:hypothetical protein
MNLWLEVVLKDTGKYVTHIDLRQTPTDVTYYCLYINGDYKQGVRTFEETYETYLAWLRSIENYEWECKRAREYHDSMMKDPIMGDVYAKYYSEYTDPEHMDVTARRELDDEIAQYKEMELFDLKFGMV